MIDTRGRLAALCAAAGYPNELLELIAQATFSRHKNGDALSEPQLRQLAEAVKVLVQAGRKAEHLPVLAGEYQARHGERWREVFWKRTLRTAAIRRTGCTPRQRDVLPERRAAQNGRVNKSRARQAEGARTRPA